MARQAARLRPSLKAWRDQGDMAENGIFRTKVDEGEAAAMSGINPK
jgi:hypothetical protein